MERIAAALLILFSLSACAVADKYGAEVDVKASKAAYKQCLAAHPADLSACEGARLAYRADIDTYRNFSAGIRFGRSDTVEIMDPGH